MTAEDHTLSIDETYMRQCIEAGRRAALKGEPPVGAIVLCTGRVLAEASEETRSRIDVTAHAEVLAIQKATEALGSIDLHACTLFTNVEPCVFCSYAIRRTGIGRVVIGAPTNVLGGINSNHPILVDSEIPGFSAPPRITEGVLLEECLALRMCANLSWKLKRLQTPWFDGIGRNNIKPVRERSRDEESVTFGKETQEVACAG